MRFTKTRRIKLKKELFSSLTLMRGIEKRWKNIFILENEARTRNQFSVLRKKCIGRFASGATSFDSSRKFFWLLKPCQERRALFMLSEVGDWRRFIVSMSRVGWKASVMSSSSREQFEINESSSWYFVEKLNWSFWMLQNRLITNWTALQWAQLVSTRSRGMFSRDLCRVSFSLSLPLSWIVDCSNEIKT